MNGTMSPYLAKHGRRAADVNSRRHLRSVSKESLAVPSTRRPTLGDRAFPINIRLRAHPNTL